MGTEARSAAMEMEVVCPCPAEGEANPRAGSCRRGSTIFICVAFALMACLLGFMFWTAAVTKDPQYSVAITAVSGLDPAANAGGRPAVLDLGFTLDLRIASRSPIRDGCFEPGTSLEVSYRDIALARVTPPEMCAKGLHGTAQATVVAWGAGARLPGYALDSLAADVRRGAEAFDVTLRIPSKIGLPDMGQLVSCRGRRVGDADALWTPCELTFYK